MAYTKTDAGSGLDNVFDNSYVTKNELYAILDQLKEDSKFYELEVFEVVEILENPAEIVGRYVFSEQGDSIDEIEGRTFLPLNSNILQYPLRGELWLGMEYKGNHYYLSRLSEDITNVNFSKFNESTRVEEITTDLSRGENFVDIKPIHAPTQIGDTLVQGRFNNYLKLGNTDNVGTIEINNDSSFLKMYETGNLEVSSSNDIFILSENNVNVNSNFFNLNTEDNIKIISSTETNIDSPKINIGLDSLVPAVLGNQDLIKVVDIILNMQIENNLIEIGEQVASPAPNAVRIAELTEENVDLNRIKNERTYLSKKVNVE
tara:strand:+ start:63 stop:1016 length:954 start_codon:yes stop_codon:yes gene_type:complete